MIEVPTKVGSSEIKLSGISNEQQDQFQSVLTEIDQYSKSIVSSFDSVVSKLSEKLKNSGDAAGKSASTLKSMIVQLDSSSSDTFNELDSVTKEIDGVIEALPNLDAIEAEVLRISDALTTLEFTVKSSRK